MGEAACSGTGVEYPYRQARSLLRHEIGDEISYGTIHRWAQEEGKKLREEEEARQETVFGRAEKVRNDGKEREMVVLEVDGTLLHSQEKGEPKSIRGGDARRGKAVP